MAAATTRCSSAFVPCLLLRLLGCWAVFRLASSLLCGGARAARILVLRGCPPAWLVVGGRRRQPHAARFCSLPGLLRRLVDCLLLLTFTWLLPQRICRARAQFERGLHTEATSPWLLLHRMGAFVSSSISSALATECVNFCHIAARIVPCQVRAPAKQRSYIQNAHVPCFRLLVWCDGTTHYDTPLYLMCDGAKSNGDLCTALHCGALVLKKYTPADRQSTHRIPAEPACRPISRSPPETKHNPTPTPHGHGHDAVKHLATSFFA